MPVAVALLRGINVGGKHKLPMAELRELCGKLGWTDVATLIASGNVVFRCGTREVATAGAKLEGAIEKAFGFRPGVVVRPLSHARAAIGASPYAKAGNPSHILLMFLASEPGAEAKKAIAALKPEPERLSLVGDVIHLHYPLGIGQSKFAFTVVERAAGIAGTCRNLNTITKLVAMGEKLDE